MSYLSLAEFRRKIMVAPLKIEAKIILRMSHRTDGAARAEASLLALCRVVTSEDHRSN